MSERRRSAGAQVVDPLRMRGGDSDVPLTELPSPTSPNTAGLGGLQNISEMMGEHPRKKDSEARST